MKRLSPWLAVMVVSGACQCFEPVGECRYGRCDTGDGGRSDGGADAGQDAGMLELGAGTYSGCQVLRALAEEHLLKQHDGFCSSIDLVWPGPAGFAVDASVPFEPGQRWSVGGSVHTGPCSLPLQPADAGAVRSVRATNGSGFVGHTFTDAGYYLYQFDVTLTFDAGALWPSFDRLRANGVSIAQVCP